MFVHIYIYFIYVCVYICMYTHTYIYIQEHIPHKLDIYTYAYICVCTNISFTECFIYLYNVLTWKMTNLLKPIILYNSYAHLMEFQCPVFQFIPHLWIATRVHRCKRIQSQAVYKGWTDTFKPMILYFYSYLQPTSVLFYNFS